MIQGFLWPDLWNLPIRSQKKLRYLMKLDGLALFLKLVRKGLSSPISKYLP